MENKQCYGCDGIFTPDTEGEQWCYDVWICLECYNKMDNVSGYCSLDCQLGFGCDGSC